VLDFSRLALRHFSNLALFFFVFALCLIPLALAASAIPAGFHLARQLVTLRRATFSVSTPRARPGDTIETLAEVIPRSSRAITVEVRLICTMFDHRAHQLFASTRTMRPRAPGSNQYVATLVLPPYALRTGRVGDRQPNPLSERAHRMLVVWTVDFVVRSAQGTTLLRKSHALEVPSGRRLKTHLRRMSLLAVDTFSAARNDMLFNWLVHLAACDGTVNTAERDLLSELLSEMGGMVDLELAVARIEWELQRKLVIDDVFLRRYVPLDARLEFYRGLYTLALVDGPLSDKERAFLANSLRVFGITGAEVQPIEKEVADARTADPVS
jgi:uncharacterized tellurite resistance protein B-like protein